MSARIDSLGLTRTEWEALMESWNLPRYRGRQVFDGLHRRFARDYGAIRELPADLRERLAAEAPVVLPEIARRDVSVDGSVKYGLRLADGALVEAVFMPGEASRATVNEFADARVESPKSEVQSPESDHRGTLKSPITNHQSPIPFTVCLSSQTGCAVDCQFCVTGKLGGGRNLTAGEILGQLHAVLADARATIDGLRVVFMGMGEPFLNPGGVLPALDILFELVSPRRVTVSTSGITPAFAVFAARPRRPNLAVSVNAGSEETRTRLMPITKTHALSEVVDAMRRWPLEPRRRITVEYVLIAGVNDAPEEAAQLARRLSGIPVKINLIPFNEDPVYLPGLARPDEAAVDRFAARLVKAHLPVTVRRSRGPDARAACGQLKGRTLDPRRRPAGTGLRA
jgi:23S rRNA (adenine2503-C2)-methyltransferase